MVLRSIRLEVEEPGREDEGTALSFRSYPLGDTTWEGSAQMILRVLLLHIRAATIDRETGPLGANGSVRNRREMCPS